MSNFIVLVEVLIVYFKNYYIDQLGSFTHWKAYWQHMYVWDAWERGMVQHAAPQKYSLEFKIFYYYLH